MRNGRDLRNRPPRPARKHKADYRPAPVWISRLARAQRLGGERGAGFDPRRPDQTCRRISRASARKRGHSLGGSRFGADRGVGRNSKRDDNSGDDRHAYNLEQRVVFHGRFRLTRCMTRTAGTPVSATLVKYPAKTGGTRATFTGAVRDETIRAPGAPQFHRPARRCGGLLTAAAPARADCSRSHSPRP